MPSKEAQVVHERGRCLCIIKDSTWWVGCLWSLWARLESCGEGCGQPAGLSISPVHRKQPVSFDQRKLSEGDVHKSTGSAYLGAPRGEGSGEGVARASSRVAVRAREQPRTAGSPPRSARPRALPLWTPAWCSCFRRRPGRVRRTCSTAFRVAVRHRAT